MRLLDGVEFLLLIRRQDWPNLRQRAVDHGFHFLHRLLMNGGDLRFSLIEDRLNLGLLLRCETQSVRNSLKSERVTVCASGSGFSLDLGNDKTAQRDRTGGQNC